MNVRVADSFLVTINSRLNKNGHSVSFGYYHLLIVIFLPLLFELQLGNGRKHSSDFVRLMDFAIILLEISFNRLQLIASFGRRQYAVSPSVERKSNEPLVPEVTLARRTQHTESAHESRMNSVL